ncbi:MAG: hypothetical protein QXF41_02520 [Candidatus Micrarchaeaceae archaeon]
MTGVREIIIETLSDYGDTVRNVVLWHLETVYHIDLNNVENNPVEFVVALKDIFDGWEKDIEESVCQKIAIEYNIQYKGEGLVKLLGRARPTV